MEPRLKRSTRSIDSTRAINRQTIHCRPIGPAAVGLLATLLKWPVPVGLGLLQGQAYTTDVFKPRLHDTTGCQTGCTTGLTTVLNEQLFVQPVVKPGCTTRLTTGLTTCCIV